MKIALISSYYKAYLHDFYRRNPCLNELPHRQQLDVLLLDYFSWQQAVILRLIQQSHEVQILPANAKPIQQAWAKENRVTVDRNWQFSIPIAQIQQFKPDILLVNSTFRYLTEDYLSQLKPYCRKIFAWIASPLPNYLNLSSVDCILTSHENFQRHFLQREKASELLLPAFEPKIATALTNIEKDIDCSFIGSLFYKHIRRMEILKRLIKETPITIWSDRPTLLTRGLLQPGYIAGYVSMEAFRKYMKPGVWGMEMYQTVARSKICINVHIDVAGGLAGNIRTFEVPGCGSLLITENTPNMHRLFEPNEEVVVYDSADELVEKIRYYLNTPDECNKIATAGQKRTLESHNSLKRSQELLDIFKKYI
jgi:spore maturation protein CgeB